MSILKIILCVILNMVFPFLFINLLMFIDFFINGSGMQSEVNYEKYKFIWIAVFIFPGVVQLFFVDKCLKLNSLKYTLQLFIFFIYCYIGYKYFGNA